MFTRSLRPPESSFFLFGARGTGKTTWIHEHFAGATHYDLLRPAESLRLSRDPSVLAAECEELPRGSWIVLDEVQRVPALLDEVQHLIARRGHRFVLSGSSARKLKRGGANLLAGRAEIRHLYPLTTHETGFAHELDRLLTGGLLPLALEKERPRSFLRSYCEVYLREEIQAEALVRQIGPYQRFLEVAARANAQILNVASIARDTGIARQTAQEYFQILIDTLLAFWLPSWKAKRGVKQVAHPKLYWFDPGVARELAGTGHHLVHPEERGFLFETFLMHEVRAFLHYTERDYPMFYWRTHEGAEVDLVIETPRRLVALEFKAKDTWEARDARGLANFAERNPDREVLALGVFTGARALLRDGLRVLPWKKFVQELWAGELA